MRLGILTGGGDVTPLNAVISSAIKKCRDSSVELIGFLKGWEGIIEDKFIRLNDLKVDENIGGTILKSSRINLRKIKDGQEKILQKLNQQKIDGLIVIGGEDTISNALLIKDFPKVIISKTIDNDVGLYKAGSFLNYFTLGYPTASEKIASFVSLSEGMRTTAYSHERIIVIESMGMHAGWLALASSQGEPDFIIIPEFPLDLEYFKEKVISRYKQQKHVIIVISEGARWKNGSYISADETNKDSFGHPHFIGAADVLAKLLKEQLKGYFDTRNVNSVNPSYLYRSGRPNDLDKQIASKMGSIAIEHLINSKDTVFLYTEHKIASVFNVKKYNFNSINNIEEFHRFVDQSLYDPEKLEITMLGKKYYSTFVPSFFVSNYNDLT